MDEFAKRLLVGGRSEAYVAWRLASEGFDVTLLSTRITKDHDPSKPDLYVKGIPIEVKSSRFHAKEPLVCTEGQYKHRSTAGELNRPYVFVVGKDLKVLLPPKQLSMRPVFDVAKSMIYNVMYTKCGEMVTFDKFVIWLSETHHHVL